MASIDVDSLLADEVETSRKALCYKVVDTFAGICGRKLWLKDGTHPLTNGHLIEVPFKHPRAYQYTEHEVSHILFESDPIAKTVFLDEYASKIGAVASKAGYPINERMLRGGLDGVIAVLDDERVISLWGLLYKGSEAIMRHMKAEEARPYLDHAHTDFLSLLSALASGNDVPPGELDRFRPYMIEALRKVHKRDYFGCLVAAKWLVVQLVTEIIRAAQGEDPPPMPGASLGSMQRQMGGGTGVGKGAGEEGEDTAQGGAGDFSGDEDTRKVPRMPWEPPESSEDEQGAGTGDGGGPWEPPEVHAGVERRSQALQETVNRLGQVPGAIGKQLKDEVTESKFKRRGEEAAAQRKAKAAINADVKDAGHLEDALSNSAGQMQYIVQRARNVCKNAPNHDDSIRRDAYAKVIFKDVEPSPHRDPHLRLKNDDEQTVKRLRAMFHRVMGRRVNVLEDCGSVIDIPAYLDYRMTGQPQPVFRVDRRGRGFRTIVLIDRSSSMQGARTATAERACQIISKALDFPFVNRKVWGFQSWGAGEVDITRFTPGQEIFESDAATVGGTTPLHTAIRVSLRDLEDGTDRKHLFVISDGFPVYVRRDGHSFGTKTLMGFVRENIMSARSKGIGVTGVMIGKDMHAKSMGYMFGPSKYWRVVDDRTFGTDLIGLVTTAFVEYLRSR